MHICVFNVSREMKRLTNRLKKMTEWLKKENIDVAFITSSDNVFYLTGFNCHPHERLLGLAIFPDAEPFIVCPAMEKQDAINTGWDFEVVGYNDTDPVWDMVKQALTKRVQAPSTWAIEKNQFPVSRYEEVTSRFSVGTFINAEDQLNQLRLIKDEKEIAALRQACEIADFAIEVGMNEITEGKTELDIVAAIEYEVKKKGVTGMSFATTVLAGANAASPHGNPGLTKVKKGDFVLFDLGVIYDGYCSDITRTIAYGDISDQQLKVYETVRKAEETALQLSKPGITAMELDLAARKVIEDAGYGEYFTHRLGHGLGISVHEFPSITSTNQLKLVENMVYTIEPGIYIPNQVGVRIEDDVIITKDGAESLTKFPKTLQIVN